MEFIGEFQVYRKFVEFLDDDFVVLGMEFYLEYYKFLKEKDFWKLRIMEEDFVFLYGLYVFFFVCCSFLVVFFNISGIFFNFGVYYDRLVV